MNRFLTVLFITVAMLSVSAYAAPPLATITKAKTTAENARYLLPLEVTPNIMLTQVSYDSKTYSLVYRYHFTIPVTKPSAKSINETKLGVVHMMKANPNSEEMQLVKNGITFYYNYYDQNGNFMYAIKITPTDIR